MRGQFAAIERGLFVRNIHANSTETIKLCEKTSFKLLILDADLAKTE